MFLSGGVLIISFLCFIFFRPLYPALFFASRLTRGRRGPAGGLVSCVVEPGRLRGSQQTTPWEEKMYTIREPKKLNTLQISIV